MDRVLGQLRIEDGRLDRESFQEKLDLEAAINIVDLNYDEEIFL